MYLTVQGLVLRTTAYNDTDVLLSVLTRTHGKLTVKVRGLRKKNSPLAAPCQLFAYSEFTLFAYRDFYTVNEAHAVALFQELRKDIVKLSLGTYFAQVADVISQEDLPNPELLPLVLNCLYALCRLNVPESQAKAVFELRSACLAGYEPDLTGCCCCRNPMPERFDIYEGRLECSSCRDPNSTGIRMPVDSGVLDAMRYITACDPKRLFAFSAGQQTLSSLSQLSESYLMTQLERSFSALDFYKSLQVNPV